MVLFEPKQIQKIYLKFQMFKILKIKGNMNAGYRGDELIGYMVRTFILDRNAHILDVGAGTGLLALNLVKDGYFNIDAMDMAEKMLKKARERSLYKNYFLEGVFGDKQTSLEESKSKKPFIQYFIYFVFSRFLIEIFWLDYSIPHSRITGHVIHQNVCLSKLS